MHDLEATFTEFVKICPSSLPLCYLSFPYCSVTTAIVVVVLAALNATLVISVNGYLIIF